MHYKDFELELGTAEGEGVYAVRVESPYMDPVEATFEMPYDDLEFEGVKRDLELAVLKGSGTRRSLVPEQTDKVKLFGETMFNAIFTGDVAESYKDALRRAKEERMGLRIRLTTKAPELGAIAWEFLRDPGESWLVLDQATPIVRHMRKLGDEDLPRSGGPAPSRWA